MKPEKLKVVIDTNVLISSLWGGKPHDIIELWDKNKLLVIVSQQIIDEYFNVLNRFELTEEDIEDLTILFSDPQKSLLVEPKTRTRIIKKDPADNKFLDCALEGKADYIISGDKHLLKLEKFKKIPIINHSNFVNKTKS